MSRHSSIVSLAAAAAAGALCMYYLDAANGARRRAFARDKAGAAGRELASGVRLKGRHVADRVKGAVAARHMGEPSDGGQLHDRVRARLGHLVSHPKSVRVEVAQDGTVCLKGDVLAAELERVVAEVAGMPGVRVLRSELVGHETAQSIPHATQHPLAAAELQEHAQDAWNEQGL